MEKNTEPVGATIAEILAVQGLQCLIHCCVQTNLCELAADAQPAILRYALSLGAAAGCDGRQFL